jgi:hypothetical protein
MVVMGGASQPAKEGPSPHHRDATAVAARSAERVMEKGWDDGSNERDRVAWLLDIHGRGSNRGIMILDAKKEGKVFRDKNRAVTPIQLLNQ